MYGSLHLPFERRNLEDDVGLGQAGDRDHCPFLEFKKSYEVVNNVKGFKGMIVVL